MATAMPGTRESVPASAKARRAGFCARLPLVLPAVGRAYASVAPLFEHYGIQLWTPGVGGRADWHVEDHEQAMLALGLSSKREITRTRIRVRTAMAAQTREQGRYPGGRPPYGYRLGDAGPHPNKAHAAWGRRSHRLEPGPATAPVVSWMFVQRLAGHSAARITRAPNDAAIPCPSAADPGRNPHRRGVDAADGRGDPGQPRYTGRQVWNRQRADFDLVDPANTGLGHKQVQRWNLPEGWVISKRPAHAALVSEAGFIATRTRPRRAARPGRQRDGTGWPGCWPAGGAAGWNRPGPTASPLTGAVTAIPAPPSPGPRAPRTPTGLLVRRWQGGRWSHWSAPMSWS